LTSWVVISFSGSTLVQRFS